MQLSKQVFAETTVESPLALIKKHTHYFFDNITAIPMPCCIQKKVAGVRVLCKKSGIYVEKGTDHKLVKLDIPSIQNELSVLFEEFDSFTDFEGYLSNHNAHSRILFEEDILNDSESLRLYIADIPDSDYIGHARFNILKEVQSYCEEQGMRKISVLDSTEIDTISEMLDYHELYRSRGYEGIIVTSLKKVYPCRKRTRLKLTIC